MNINQFKIQQMLSLITSADAICTEQSPFMLTERHVVSSEIIGCPENEVIHISWEENDLLFTDILTEEDLIKATIVDGNIHIPEADDEVMIIKLFTITPKFIEPIVGADSSITKPDDFAKGLMKELGGSYEFLRASLFDMNEDSGLEDDTDVGIGYELLYKPHHLTIRVTAFESDYEVAIVENGNIGEYVEHVSSETHIKVTVKQLISTYSKDH